MQQVRNLGVQAIAAAELDVRKASLVGEYGRYIATSSGLAGQLSTYAAYGRDLGEVGRFTQRVEAVTPAMAQAAGPATGDPSQASLVIVGDAKQFIGPLRAKFPDVQAIPAASLDLDSPTLAAR